MPGLEFQAFSAEHLDDAARLLEERHRRHLDHEPLLAAEPDVRAEIEQASAHEHGYAAMTTDWRMNLFASRFWPKRGFRPTFLRLYRSIP